MSVITNGQEPISPDCVWDMTDALAHRGPDDAGYAQVDIATGRLRTWTRLDERPREPLAGVVFGHRRLSIIELTDAGHQPYVSPESGNVLVYNGEIFNFVELRDELSAEGVRFSTRSDTEVLLRAYDRWGTDAFGRFNGMWAFVIWDPRRRRLVACRDRFGIKPLYYSRLGSAGWILASEIKALRAMPTLAREANAERVQEFLVRAAIDHRADTLFAGVHAVAPGSFMEIHGEHADVRRFWTLAPNPAVTGQGPSQLIRRFDELLSDAVRLRTRSDVPIGTMLSGGIDSTSITALIHGQQRASERAPIDPFEGLRAFHSTFSACWPGLGLDEELAIDAFCRTLGLESHRLYLTGEQAADILPSAVYYLDEPFESPVAIVQLALMRQARSRGVTVVLNGHGADELLAGYPGRFVPARLASLLRSGRVPSFFATRRAFRQAGEWNDRAVLVEIWRSLVPARARRQLEGVVQSRQARSTGLFEHVRFNVATEWSEESVRWPVRPSLLQASLWKHYSERLLPQWLRKEDRMSMAASVESRAPFTDHRLVEFALALPDTMLLQQGLTKYILRAAMHDRLPAGIAWNPRKQRFASPAAGWFRSSWRALFDDLLLSGSPRIRSYINTPVLQRKLRAFLDGDNRALDANLAWRILNTELWLRRFNL